MYVSHALEHELRLELKILVILSGLEPQLKLFHELSWFYNITLILYADGTTIGPRDKVVLP